MMTHVRSLAESGPLPLRAQVPDRSHLLELLPWAILTSAFSSNAWFVLCGSFLLLYWFFRFLIPPPPKAKRCVLDVKAKLAAIRNVKTAKPNMADAEPCLRMGECGGWYGWHMILSLAMIEGFSYPFSLCWRSGVSTCFHPTCARLWRNVRGGGSKMDWECQDWTLS